MTGCEQETLLSGHSHLSDCWRHSSSAELQVPSSSELPENYLVLRPVGQIVAVRGNCGKFPGL